MFSHIYNCFWDSSIPRIPFSGLSCDHRDWITYRGIDTFDILWYYTVGKCDMSIHIILKDFHVIIGTEFCHVWQVVAGRLSNCDRSRGRICISFGMCFWRRRICCCLKSKCSLHKTSACPTLNDFLRCHIVLHPLSLTDAVVWRSLVWRRCRNKIPSILDPCVLWKLVHFPKFLAAVCENIIRFCVSSVLVCDFCWHQVG